MPRKSANGRKPYDFIENPNPVPKSGFVYLVEAKGTGRFKIGKTNNLSARLTELQTGSAFKIQYVHACYAEDNTTTERQLHSLMKAYWVIGEWFSLSAAAVRETSQLMSLQHNERLMNEFLENQYLADSWVDDRLKDEPPSVKQKKEESISCPQLPLPSWWARLEEIRPQERKAVVFLYAEQGIRNKSILARRIWEISSGGGVSWLEGAKPKIERILKEEFPDLEDFNNDP